MSRQHLSPRAKLFSFIDVATIVGTLRVSVGGASRQDIHLFGYLASMVNSQYGSSPTSWGYDFAASTTGLPFAEALESAIEEMIHSGDVLDGGDGYLPSDQLSERLVTISDRESFGGRIALIEDVTNVAVLRPLPTIGRAVRAEPQLALSAHIGSVRIIDQNELAKTLFGLLTSVRDQLPPGFPPALPAMLWLDIWEKSK